MSKELTTAVYHYIQQYIAEHGFAPSLRDIAEGCYIGRSTVLRHLDRLEAQGRIMRELGKARGIILRDTLHSDTS